MAIKLLTATSRYQVTSGQGHCGPVPWSFGCMYNIPASSDGNQGALFHWGSGTSYTDHSNIILLHNISVQSLALVGVDQNSNPLGNALNIGINSIGNRTLAARNFFKSRTTTPTEGDGVNYAAVAQVVSAPNGHGIVSRIWIAPEGQAPTLVAEESISAWVEATARTLYLAAGRDASRNLRGTYERAFKVSFELTQEQIAKYTLGADPQTFGSISPTQDFFYSLASAEVSNDSIYASARQAIRNGVVSGFQTVSSMVVSADDAFLIDTDSDGIVYQRVGTAANITFKFINVGQSGATVDGDIQVIDHLTNTTIVDWTSAANNMGAIGTFILSAVPSRLGWNNFRTRKRVGGSVTGPIQRSRWRWGVGEIIFIGGQSLAQHISVTSANGIYGESVSGNPHLAFVSPNAVANGAVGEASDIRIEQITSGPGNLTLVKFEYPHQLVSGDWLSISSGSGINIAGLYQVIPVSKSGVTLMGTSAGVTTVTTLATARRQVGRWYITATAQSFPAGANAIADKVTEGLGCVVGIVNRGIGGSSIVNSNSTAADGSFAWAQARNLPTMPGNYFWYQGHGDVGQSSYGSSLSVLKQYVQSYCGSSVRFGVGAFPAVTGNMANSANAVHQFRREMVSWVSAERAAGNTEVFTLGTSDDLAVLDEPGGALTQNAHLHSTQQRVLGSRFGHALVVQASGSATGSALGPFISEVLTSGTRVDVVVTHRGGSGLSTPAGVTGGNLTGFEVSQNSAFSSLETIVSAEIAGPRHIRLVLASAPGKVFLRYAYGYPGTWAGSTYGTPVITSVVTETSSKILVVCQSTGSAPNIGTKLATGSRSWAWINGTRNNTEIDGRWIVSAVRSSAVVVEGAQMSGVFTSSAAFFPTVEFINAARVYDDRQITQGNLTGISGMPLMFTDPVGGIESSAGSPNLSSAAPAPGILGATHSFSTDAGLSRRVRRVLGFFGLQRFF